MRADNQVSRTDMAKQVRQRQTGYANRANGALFEEMIALACGFYMKNGIAMIEKTPEPMRIIKPLDRNSGMFMACFEKQAQPDFKGCLANGRCVVFDAKSTTTGKIHQSVLTETQWDGLETYDSMGAICFILVMMGNECYRVPWHDWKHMKEMFGHKHMDSDDLEPYRLKGNNGNVLFLGGIA